MTSDILSSLTSAATVVIYLPHDPSFPLVASGLSLYLSLKSRGTAVDIICPTPMTVAMNRLVGVDQIKLQPPGHNLVISFDYVKDAIEKVSYNVENGKFNILVQPQSGHQPLSADNVSFKVAGSAADLIVLVGNAPLPASSQNLPALSLIKNSDRALATETASLIQQANLPLDQDIADNLLIGLANETDSFTTAAAADFATAANLARHGASLTKTPASSAAPTKPDSESGAAQWTGPKIFRSGDVV